MIDKFQGETRWLSNFELCDVMYDGIIYPSSEHAFQAAKTLDIEERLQIQGASTPGKAKRLGQSVTLRSDWTVQKRIDTMREILKDKFTRNEYLRRKLIATDPQELIEGNDWNDTFWGVCNGTGSNHLGILLMSIRSQLLQDELEFRKLEKI